MSDFRQAFAELLEADQNKKVRRRPLDEEHQLQVACVRWFRYQFPGMAKHLFAVPNGGRRDKTTGAKLKAEGVVAGVSDLILMKRSGRYGALLIEMKTPTGKQSHEQKEWQMAMEQEGYCYVVCRSLDEFTRTIISYLGDF